MAHAGWNYDDVKDDIINTDNKKSMNKDKNVTKNEHKKKDDNRTNNEKKRQNKTKKKRAKIRIGEK